MCKCIEWVMMCVFLVSCLCRCWSRCGGCRLWETVSQSPRCSPHSIDTRSHQWQSDIFPLCCCEGAPEAICRRSASSETCGAGKCLQVLQKWKNKQTKKRHCIVTTFIKKDLFSKLQVTDKNDLQFLNSWHELNKPHVLLFDQVPAVPLLYKVSVCSFLCYM